VVQPTLCYNGGTVGKVVTSCKSGNQAARAGEGTYSPFTLIGQGRPA